MGQAEGAYEYHPGYGLDVYNFLPARGSQERVEVGYAALDRPVSIEGLGLFRDMDEWRLGREGRRRYHDYLTLPSSGAI